MLNPAGVLLNHLKVLADSGTVNRGTAFALYGAFDRAIDWSMVQQIQSLYLYRRCFKALFDATNDLSELSGEQTKNLLLSAARTATPLDFTPKDSPKELSLAGR